MMLRILNFFMLFWLFLSPINNPASATENLIQENLIQEKLVLHSYHAFPPFLTGTKTGLTYDLADYLNHQQSDYIFEVKLMPRKRLDSMLDRESIIIPWVTAAWFGPDAAMKYQWSPPVMKDGNLYIWKTGSDTSFRRPLDLVGYKLGGIRGYQYVSVDPLVQTGQVKRTDVSTELQLFQMLLLDRVDVSIIPLSGAEYLIRENNWSADFSTAPHQSYTRQIMSSNLDPRIVNFLNRASQKMFKDENWHLVMRKYGLTPYSPENASKG